MSPLSPEINPQVLSELKEPLRIATHVQGLGRASLVCLERLRNMAWALCVLPQPKLQHWQKVEAWWAYHPKQETHWWRPASLSSRVTSALLGIIINHVIPPLLPRLKHATKTCKPNHVSFMFFFGGGSSKLDFRYQPSMKQVVFWLMSFQNQIYEMYSPGLYHTERFFLAKMGNMLIWYNYIFYEWLES